MVYKKGQIVRCNLARHCVLSSQRKIKSRKSNGEPVFEDIERGIVLYSHPENRWTTVILRGNKWTFWTENIEAAG